MNNKASTVLQDLITRFGPLGASKELSVHNTHVYRFRSDKYISPTLEDALIGSGFLPEPQKRIRSCLDWGYGEGAEEARELFNTFLKELDHGMRGVIAEWYADNVHIAAEKIGKEKATKLLYFMISWDKL